MSLEEKHLSLFAREKRVRQLQLLRHIANLDNADLEKVVATFSIQWGLRGSTVKKYLEELEIAGLVQVLGGPPYSVRVTEEGMKVLEKKGT